jgi:hypothetical protein
MERVNQGFLILGRCSSRRKDPKALSGWFTATTLGLAVAAWRGGGFPRVRVA